MESHSCLITGATGAIGPTLVRHLLNQGWQVRVLSRQPPPLEIFPAGVQTIQGDLLDEGALCRAVSGVKRIFHLASLLHIGDPPANLLPAYFRVNVEGTRAVIQQALKSGVERVVFFSTISVYGGSAGQILTEESPAISQTFYAQTKREAEEVVLRAKRPDGGPIGSVLRLAAVYGPRVKGYYRRLLDALVKGRFVPIGPGDNRRTVVYDKDVASAAFLVSSHRDAGGRIFNVSDGTFHTVAEIIETICESLERRTPHFSLPRSVVRWAVGCMEDGFQLLGRQSPVRRSMIEKYTEDVAVDSSRIREQLGFEAKYDLRTGWRETIAALRQTGKWP